MNIKTLFNIKSFFEFIWVLFCKPTFDFISEYMWDHHFLIYRGVMFWWQRRVRGWDDSDTWSLDHTIAKLVLPRLKRFRKLNIGYPANLQEVEWNLILDEMIEAFEIIEKDDYWELTDDERSRISRGLDKFREYYFDLWW